MSAPRPARLHHVPQLTAILWAFSRRAPWLPRVRARRTDLRLMAKITHRGWVRIVPGRRGPVGFIARDGARIHALYVHPRAHRSGLGTTLLEDAKSRSKRLELWVAEANHPARAFYAAHDFTEAARTEGGGNDENLPDILMVWPPEERAQARSAQP
ncbi:GNAT family N-acetyltransferase [Pseudohalocynthiibacter aestuariivivens]|uniref:GNAT family N-acetyltransferase n=1 Tax=Roseovarius pelagicus TaxID=2980108 RepID=A0ABY6DFV0_9RHOB|nr:MULTISPECIES: GNAT family N-acetyltransferase [Rhodobacterales]QIE46441.1 GNAT family N-acetyltransferase [Pseudohalocynthiibacter aestuariivivens]UXX85037.1 GNAT family N-acetyltransferase [Roseovarius pelagicus]